MQENLCQAFLHAKHRPKDQVAIITKRKGKWVEYNWQEYYKMVETIAAGLLAIGIAREDRVAIQAETSLEWAILDYAILSIGAVTVPIYTSNTYEDISFIIENSGAKLLFTENSFQSQKVEKLNIDKVQIHSEPADHLENIESWQNLEKSGEEYLLKNPEFFSEAVEKVKLNDLASIVYTSGTTGKPKGVMLSHQQIVSEIQEVFPILNISDQDRSITFLPFSHILGRVELWAHAFAGFTMAFVESIEKIRKNFLDIHPTFMVSVPRIFEKVYNGVLSQAESSPIKAKLFRWALKIGKQYSKKQMNNETIPFSLLLEYKLAYKLFFSKLHEKLGGKIRISLSGGAPLSKEIGEFFHAAGLLILEGYGLTETTAGACINSPYEYRFGTVGKPIGDVQLKFADDGEIMIKSKKVMTGYYKNPEATERAFEDGWFKTGDIGELTPEGFLRITDRKKDLIKTAGGKYIAPQKIENLLVLNKYISNAIIHGDKKKYIVALIALNFEEIETYAKSKGLSFASIANLSQHAQVRDLIRNAVAQVNSQLASFESVKNFAILDHELSIENGELTPSMKVRRKFCEQKYKILIDELYCPDASIL